LIPAYRLIKSKYAGNPLDPDGAKRYGGRWNSKGVVMVYASDSIALAALEKLVHLHQTDILSAFTLCTLTLPKTQVMVLDTKVLPSDWRKDPISESTMAIGDEWMRSLKSLGLWVPSTIIPEQSNLLVNPDHPDFPEVVKKLKMAPFSFDPRFSLSNPVVSS